MIECYQASELKKVLFLQISLIKFFFDLPLLEHHNIRPFGVNALNGESIIRYPLTFLLSYQDDLFLLSYLVDLLLYQHLSYLDQHLLRLSGLDPSWTSFVTESRF